MIDTSKLPKHALQEVREFTKDNRLYSRPSSGPFDLSEAVDIHVRSLTPEEFLDYWLKWNGIIGFTDSIVAVLDKAREARFDLVEEVRKHCNATDTEIRRFLNEESVAGSRDEIVEAFLEWYSK